MDIPKIPVWKQSEVLRKTESFLSLLEDTFNIVAVGFIMLMMFLATAEIFGRYFFNQPIPGQLEIVELIMAAVVFLGMAYTQRKDGHVRMEIFLTRVLKGRAYHIAESFSLILSLFIYSIITVYSFQFALDAFSMGDVTAYIYAPTWPSKLCVPVGGFLLCLRFIIQFIQHLLQAITGVEMRNLE